MRALHDVVFGKPYVGFYFLTAEFRLIYSYDAINRVITRNDDSFGYNTKSEVTFANISNSNSRYGYDEIGNSTNWVANCLNQYTSFTYDIDGNLLSDETYSYTYDVANQLKTVSANGVMLLTNDYDSKSRRVRKVTPAATTTYFYDDWNLIEERIAYTNGGTSIIHYYWGKDLSGGFQGADGVGGLLYLTIDGSTFIPLYDNNGNITHYLDSNGNVVAQYTYDAFGNTIAQGGLLVNTFRHRYSTKYLDTETSLYYYGYRFYHPTLMRWLNRDPIEEDGGINLYAFCGNNSISKYDVLGLWLPTSASYKDKRRVYRKYKGDTISRLADEVGMDVETFHLWARVEKYRVASSDSYAPKPNMTDEDLENVCFVSVPNIWIQADLLRGGGVWDRIINLGGTICSFFGQTLGRWGYYVIKPKTTEELLSAVKNNRLNLYGMTIYAHGNSNGIIAPLRKSNSKFTQSELMVELIKNKYRIARVNLMQCYSITEDGKFYFNGNSYGKFNYKTAWENLAVDVSGYEGINVIGIDF